MRRFITAGMVGTAQIGGELPASEAPSESLVGVSEGGDIERAYLLRAGTAAICQAAGYAPTRLDDIHPGVSTESLPFCKPAVEALIETLLDDHRTELLIEALDLLRSAGQALSPTLLPTALEQRAPELRAAIAPVIGERGRWLSQFNPSWRWVADTLADTTGALPANAESLWQEGSLGQRVEILRRLRATDPDRAREWLAQTWKREKAETRADLLKTLQVGLSPDDEPLLESTLDDRAATVRAVAVDLLARLPESALSHRMRGRAESMLTFAQGKLDANPPTQLPPDWLRDGVGPQSIAERHERGSWLSQVVRLVPCAVWEQRFKQSPDVLVPATSESPWSGWLLDGWTRSAARQHDADWSLALWRYWLTAHTNHTQTTNRNELRGLVAPFVPIAEREAYAASYFTDTGNTDGASFADALRGLPTPWTREFGLAYLAALHAFVAALSPGARDFRPWDETLAIAALVIPPVCFETALEPFVLPEGDNLHIHNFRGQLGMFADTIRLRKQLYEEIPLP